MNLPGDSAEILRMQF